MEGQIEALTGHVAQLTDKVTSHSSGLTGFIHSVGMTADGLLRDAGHSWPLMASG
jgi:hypothetical protein